MPDFFGHCRQVHCHLEAQNAHPKPQIPKQHSVYANLSKSSHELFSAFLMRVRNTAWICSEKLVQMNFFILGRFYRWFSVDFIGWVFPPLIALCWLLYKPCEHWWLNFECSEPWVPKSHWLLRKNRRPCYDAILPTWDLQSSPYSTPTTLGRSSRSRSRIFTDTLTARLGRFATRDWKTFHCGKWFSLREQKPFVKWPLLILFHRVLGWRSSLRHRTAFKKCFLTPRHGPDEDPRSKTPLALKLEFKVWEWKQQGQHVTPSSHNSLWELRFSKLMSPLLPYMTSRNQADKVWGDNLHSPFSDHPFLFWHCSYLSLKTSTFWKRLKAIPLSSISLFTLNAT